MKIPKELLDKYSICQNPAIVDEIGVYRTFLIQTDYICNKIIEGVATWEEYADEKQYRQVAREEIGRLSEEANEEEEA